MIASGDRRVRNHRLVPNAVLTRVAPQWILRITHFSVWVKFPLRREMLHESSVVEMVLILEDSSSVGGCPREADPGGFWESVSCLSHTSLAPRDYCYTAYRR
jgi:hypothetical protein